MSRRRKPYRHHRRPLNDPSAQIPPRQAGVPPPAVAPGGGLSTATDEQLAIELAKRIGADDRARGFVLKSHSRASVVIWAKCVDLNAATTLEQCAMGLLKQYAVPDAEGDGEAPDHRPTPDAPRGRRTMGPPDPFDDEPEDVDDELDRVAERVGRWE